MGVKLTSLSYLDEKRFYYIISDVSNDIGLFNKNLVDLNINKIINILVSFTLSDKFFPFVYIVNKNSRLSYEFILSIFESKAKFLSLKIFLPLFEQLKKNKNFIKQMSK